MITDVEQRMVISVEVVPRLNFASQQNGFALLRDLRIENLEANPVWD